MIWFVVALVAVFVSHSFKNCSGRDLDVETAHELRRAIQSYEDEFGGMDSMTSAEIMRSLSGSNPRNLIFYDSKRETNMRLVEGEFVCRSGKKLDIFFSNDKLLITVVNHWDNDSQTPHPEPSTRMIKCVVGNRTMRK